MTSRVAVVTAPNADLEIQTVPIPELEPNSLLIRVDATTLCGTDAHRWQGHTAPRELPFVPGHETCGTIVDMRGEVRTLMGEPLAPGDRIISSYSHCGHCDYCRVARQTTLCARNIVYGSWSPHKLLGGCAEYHYFPAGASFVKVPPDVSSPLAASSVCALRTVLHGFEQLGRIASFESVLILGAGPLGLYATAVARDHGAGRVIAIGAPQTRVRVAQDFGADDVLDLDSMPELDDRVQWVHERTGGRGADITFNCASSPAFVDALRMTRPGGRLVTIGVSGGPPLSIPPRLFYRGISIASVVMGEARHFFEAIAFIAGRKDAFPFEKMLSNTYSLDQATTAIRGMASFAEIKPVILPHAAHI